MSLLLVVDMQERLAPAVADIEQITANSVALLSAADRLSVPARVTEHCADKIGPTIAPIRGHMATAAVLSKRYFSACAESAIVAQIVATQRSQVVIAGVETHVCVLQTALDLQRAGYRCFLVEDASGTRKLPDKQAAVARMRDAGVQIVTTEMVLFEWLRRGDSQAFKDLFPLIRNR